MPMAVESRTSLNITADVPGLYIAPCTVHIRNILDVAKVGVIATDIPVISVQVAVTALVKVSVLVALTTCNTLPAGNAALATPVQLVRTPDAGVPKAGVTNVGEVNVTPESTLFVTILEIAIIYPA